MKRLILSIVLIVILAVMYFAMGEKQPENPLPESGNLILNNSKIGQMHGNKIHGKVVIDGVVQE